MKIQKEAPVRKESKLSRLYAYRSKLEEWLERKRRLLASIQQEVDEKQKKLDNVNKDIEGINDRLLVSTHALERWISRIDPQGTEETMRARICTPQFMKIVDTLPGGKFPHEEGFFVVVRDRKIISVFTKDE